MSVLAGILGAVAVWSIDYMTREKTPTVMTLNVRALIDAEVARIAQSKLNSESAAEEVKRSGKRLSILAEQIAKEKQVILLPENVVIAGARDITPMVKERLHASTP